MKEKSTGTVSIIGGADGPTSVFVVGRTGKKTLKERVRNHIYAWKRKRAEKKIFAGTHSLEEVVAYAMDRYGAIEVNKKQEKYAEQRRNLKESLIIMHRPELLGDMKDISRPDVYDEDSIREFYDQIQARSEMIAKIPDSEIPMDFHIYEIKIGDDDLEMEIDYVWNIFGVSYCGNKKVMKQFEKMAQDLYIYYGVSEDDIRNKTERYSSLLAALSA